MKRFLFLTLLITHAVTAQQPPPDLNSYLKGKSSTSLSDTRYQMLTDAGLTLGFRGGKAQRAWELRQALESRTSTLDALYDFRPLTHREGWLPPVIDEARDVATITDDQIRTASTIYTIVLPERFISNPPSWRTWLYAGLDVQVPEGPENMVKPENAEQRRILRDAITQGWQEGRERADHTLEASFNRLTRDYRGMLLYSALLRQGKISRPKITEQHQTVTGDKQRLVTGDRVRRLQDRAGFETDKTKWKPVISREKPQ
ncbi:type IV secretory system conjugative DNA transfer family protein [Citrobacter amalonaticus]|uniref:type IV secretory system conjugative DNA transfer family protein n=1 Tax=Citrobacter amalonaticus TaxID=35703 RepID=UPI00207CDA43|nr:type IV secretory system conjugative DNA transfer family protein [Citrobacter amalonaticus]MCO4160922.1 type IV secretion system DotC family protein [Citrobacter amalonaticus]